jgi:SDR family mycofactocin-dependent oxidoreductase
MRVALVTGAAGGIGTSSVARLVADGYAVVAFDVDERVRRQEAERVASAVGDVRNRSDLDAAVGLAVERFGGLDAAVAAAAVISGGQPLWETATTELDELIDIDTKGVWNTAAAVIPVMLRQPDPRGCRFVAVASAAAHVGMFGLSAYNVAKHGVVGLVKGLAADLVGTGVTAAAVSPGSTRTPMLEATADLYGLPDVEDFSRHALVRRLLDPDDVAAAIAFCCSVEGGVVNGSVLHADGGFS